MFSSIRRRWPEAALLVALAVVAVYAGLAGRAIAIIAFGGVATFAIRRRVRDVLVGALAAIGLLAAILVVSFTIDLGQVFGGRIKQLAEQEGTKRLERPLHIGRLGIQIARGRFVVEGLRIEGRTPNDVPFFTAGRVLVDFPWWQVLSTREFYIRSVEMSDWTMQVEKYANGTNLPKLKQESKTPQGPKRFTTTVAYLHAYRGRFTYIDHGTWQTVARNLDLYLRHDTGDYLGTASITNGMVQIKDYLPMRADMRVKYRIDGSLVRLPEIILDSDGAHSVVRGQVDFGHWPEMIYHVNSQVNLGRMREIFFANDSWRSQGEARFVGTFHIFDGGHQLKGDFTSPLAHVNAFAFPDLRGSLVWEPHRFEISDASAKFYSGVARFRYRMAPLSDPKPAVASWHVSYQGVDLLPLSDALGMQGIRLLGRASGENLLEWPLGAFSQHSGSGHMTVVPPPGDTMLERAPGPQEAAIHAEAPVYGPERNLQRFPVPTAVGGEFAYRFDPEWIDVEPSHLATARTYVEFEGRTAYGDRSTFPFYARSADWQESDRLLAGIITAFGSPTGVITVGGSGEFSGTMTKSFKAPLVQGDFVGDDLRAWDVVWGHAIGRLSIENGYVDISNAVVTRAQSSIRAEGRFSLGYPRRDGGEEINARFVITSRPMRDLRHAFQLDDWPVDGSVSGAFHIYDKYTRPVGSGQLTITDMTAWGEPFERAVCPMMRFEGQGVRLDAVEIRKGAGTITGAAYVGWDGQYSFDATGEHIALATLESVQYGQVKWSGQMRFSASGAATFKSPHYVVQMSADNVAVADQRIGVVVIRLDVHDRLLMIEQLEAAGLGVSGSGQVEMSAAADAELSFRFNRTLLDPYVRLFVPKLSPYTTAMVSGTLRVVGELSNWDRLYAKATVEEVRLKLFDYDLQNDGPWSLTFENYAVRVDTVAGATGPAGSQASVAGRPALRLRSENRDTQLELSGGFDLRTQRIDVNVDGKANLAVLQAFFPGDLRSSGDAEVRGSITGSLPKPDFSGYAQITDGRLRYLALPQSIQAINGRVLIGSDGLRLNDVTAQIAGGKVTFGGRVELNGFSFGALELTASGEDMEFNYPEGFRSTVDAQFDLVGTMHAPIVRGTVTVRNAVYDKRVDLSQGVLALAGGRPSGGPAAPSSPGQMMLPVRLDLHLMAPSSLRVENNVAHVVASADLWIRGTYDHPLLSGGVDVERGDVLFEGHRYVVRRGRVEFPNPTKIEPYFDIAGETLVRAPGQTYVVNLQMTGTLKNFTTSETSDPPLSQVEILSLLFGAETTNAPLNPELGTLQVEGTEKTLAASRLQQAAAGVVSAPITRAVEQTFGLDTFQITPNVGYDPYQRLSPTARLTVGKRISNKIYLTFSRSLNTPGGADQVILLEYDQNDRLSWIFSRNEDGTYALDVRVRHVF
jgi:TamB, inner membrane protein subunit of TAM complex